MVAEKFLFVVCGVHFVSRKELCKRCQNSAVVGVECGYGCYIALLLPVANSYVFQNLDL